MATYIIGDIQGCMRTFQLLLERMAFNPDQDRLLIVGDLVNRGPSSLQALRWVHAHQHCVTMVLGNHDLALLAYANGVRALRPKDTFGDVLRADDGPKLLSWLAKRPFAVAHGDALMLHAGVMPHWNRAAVLSHAQVAQQALQSIDAAAFLAALDGRAQTPGHLAAAVDGARVLTYLRTLTVTGEAAFAYKGSLATLPKHLMPWFAAPQRQTQNITIYCGHWAALGLHIQDNIRALDTGCVWGGPLTAWCVETQATLSHPYAEAVQALTTELD